MLPLSASCSMVPAMNDASISPGQVEPLSSDERLTLLRIANSGAHLSKLRPQDVTRLVSLGLVECSPSRAKLTDVGRRWADKLAPQRD